MRWFLITFCTLSTVTCRETPPEPPPPETPSITLTIEAVGLTEAWLRITIPDDTHEREFLLARDEFTLMSGSFSGTDTVVVDTTLLPARSYNYRGFRLIDDEVESFSELMSVTAMDTTSHEWFFQSYLLGEGNSSLFYDVSIVRDDPPLVYAVGEVYVRDSLGEWEPLYNLARWDGSTWELERVSVDFRGNLVTPIVEGICVISEDDIWLAAGMAIHWNGLAWEGYDVREITGYDTLSFTSCWGRQATKTYFAGLAGSMAHYDGTNWTLVDASTRSDLQDVWGYQNPTGVSTTLAVASSPEETRILSLSGGVGNDTLAWSESSRLSGLWSATGSQIYASGAGIWRYSMAGWRQMPRSLEAIFHSGLRGSGENNIFSVAWNGIVIHFNGSTWHQYTDISEDQNFRAVTVSDELMVAVGFAGGLFFDNAVALIGRPF